MKKYGPKPLVLINGNSRPIHNRYRYKFAAKAVFRAMSLPHGFIQIWDTERGKEVGTVTKSRKTIKVEFR
jgi:hypothetical protein